MSIIVIGSLNMDMVVRTNRAPNAGETLIGQAFALSPGGKGANQAVAAARLGAEVSMVGRVGKDAFGSEMLEIIRQEGIYIEHISLSETQATGVASIVIEEDGENRIIVVSGANMELSAEDIRALEPVIRQAKLIMLQLEMELAMTEQAIAIAHKYGIPIILNPAPARMLKDEMLSQVTYLTPNETEAGILAGMIVNSIETAEQAGHILLQKGVTNVIITLGAKGTLLVNAEGTKLVPGFPVKAIDTVAAGDSFNGALAQQLVSGKTLEEALRFANAVGALAVGKEGAIPSLPYSSEVEAFLKHVSEDKEL